MAVFCAIGKVALGKRGTSAAKPATRLHERLVGGE
jgi:hypothetical protein